MKLRVRSGRSRSAFGEQERSIMARDFARLGYLVTDQPLSDDLIADLIHALEEDEVEAGVMKQPGPFGPETSIDD